MFTELPAPLAALAALVLPSHCAACGSPRRGFGGGGACRACWDSLPGPDPSACPLCAIPVPVPGPGSCVSCRREPPPVDASFAAGPYSGTLRNLVHAFKFDGFDLLAPRLARAMADAVPAGARGGGAGMGLDTVVCGVPSTRARNRERGYDPGPLLGLEAARHLGLPFRQLLLRARSGGGGRGSGQPPQSSLPAGERRRNVAGAFTALPRVRGLSLLLVDDVMTTGATAFEAAATLRSAGAASVRLLVLARTPLPSTQLPEPA